VAVESKWPADRDRDGRPPEQRRDGIDTLAAGDSDRKNGRAADQSEKGGACVRLQKAVATTMPLWEHADGLAA